MLIVAALLATQKSDVWYFKNNSLSAFFKYRKRTLPNSVPFSCFPFLLKKFRFLHDIHLLKFMSEKAGYLRHGTEKKE